MHIWKFRDWWGSFHSALSLVGINPLGGHASAQTLSCLKITFLGVQDFFLLLHAGMTPAGAQAAIKGAGD